jgi:hypothetical protein
LIKSTSLPKERLKAEQDGKTASDVFAWLAVTLGAVATAGILAALFRRWRLARRPSARPLPPPQPQAVLDLLGLSEDEAAARQLEGQDNVLRFKPPYSPREIWRANTLTIFNLSMVGLAVV